MKTAEEKAKGIVDAFVENDGLDIGAALQRAIEKRISFALKEQDRDTRHACVESVLDLPTENVHESRFNFQPDLVSVDDVTGAIMNTKSV